MRAAQHPLLAQIDVRIAVVLDRCSDRSGDHAEQLLRANDILIERQDGNVGAARSAGLEALQRAESGRALNTIWFASTDADSRVALDWLTRQVQLADEGADAIVGTVAVEDWHEHPRGTGRVFESRYRESMRSASHRHVHGANLGVRASAYARAGGVSGVPPERTTPWSRPSRRAAHRSHGLERSA